MLTVVRLAQYFSSAGGVELAEGRGGEAEGGVSCAKGGAGEERHDCREKSSVYRF